MMQSSLFPEVPELRKIRRFSGPWGFMHNFFVEPDGTLVEREYQAEKCYNLADKRLFAGLGGHAAKDLGQRVKQRPDWSKIRVEVMRELVLQKFRDHPSLRDRLLATGNWWLEEGNRHDDTFWGTVDGIGENHMGLILMEVRRILRDEYREALLRRMSAGSEQSVQRIDPDSFEGRLALGIPVHVPLAREKRRRLAAIAH